MRRRLPARVVGRVEVRDVEDPRHVPEQAVEDDLRTERAVRAVRVREHPPVGSEQRRADARARRGAAGPDRERRAPRPVHVPRLVAVADRGAAQAPAVRTALEAVVREAEVAAVVAELRERLAVRRAAEQTRIAGRSHDDGRSRNRSRTRRSACSGRHPDHLRSCRKNRTSAPSSGPVAHVSPVGGILCGPPRPRYCAWVRKPLRPARSRSTRPLPISWNRHGSVRGIAWNRAAELVAIAMAGTFLVAAVGAALLLPSGRPFAPVTAVLAVIAYAIVSRVEFEVRNGFAVPSQLVLVPMLFALPPRVVPLLVAAGPFSARPFAGTRPVQPRSHRRRECVVLARAGRGSGGRRTAGAEMA